MKRCTFLIVVTLGFGIASMGQEPLTNDSIVQMVKAGLTEDVILSVVRSQPAKYSVSPNDLIALKSSGVPDKVVAVMVERTAGNGPPRFQAPVASGATPAIGTVAAGDPDDPMAPHDSGIYLYSKDRNGKPRMIVLEQAAYQGSKTGGVFASAMTGGLKKAKMKAVLPGPRSSIRASEQQPVFYFYFEDKAAGLGKGGFGAGSVSNPNQFALVKLTVTKSSRETIIGEMGALGMSSGTHEKSIIAFKSERLRPGMYRVVPNAPLEAGEYCFLVSQMNFGTMGAGASGAAQIFDFAVTGNE